jgi:ubiquitin carboxyl-terminal hydrolase L3
MASSAEASATIEPESSNDIAAEKKFSWPPLESNPEVFTSYLHSIGLSPTFCIGEVFGFDEDLLAFLPQPVLGIIVCYERLIPKSEYREQDKGSADNYDKVNYYMHQSKVLDNACGIIACLHAIFNCPAVEVSESSVLGKFRQYTLSASPEERCTALENDTDFQTIHKTYASKGQSREITSGQDKVKHHFIAYTLNPEGQLVELDGTKAGPVIVGDCGGDMLRGSIKEVMGKLERGEISESLSMMTLNLAQD